VRDAIQLLLTPDDYLEYRARQRKKILRELLTELRAARNEEWYVSTLEFCARRRAEIEASQSRGK
jgi:hypothetical protein